MILSQMAERPQPAGQAEPSYADVAIVGAGPYGLSLAAHLQSLGPRVRIFGPAMASWRHYMPDGMLLKSDGFASSLADPEDAFTLKEFCEAEGRPYTDIGMAPVTRETFCDYGFAFQRRYAPQLDETEVSVVARDNKGFRLMLADGRSLAARNVVMAVGVGSFTEIPSVLQSLPPDRRTHSYAPRQLADFAGRRVAVVGGGASAIDLATLLAEAGATATLISRRDRLRFGGKPGAGKPSLWRNLRHPSSGLGPGWRSRLSTDAPLLIRRLPSRLRLEFVRRHLGPSASAAMRERFEAQVVTLLGRAVVGAGIVAESVTLDIQDVEGRVESEIFDHVIAATGFRVDVNRLSPLDATLRSQIAANAGYPTLSSYFETSVRDLYVIGPAAAGSFGPLMRFAYGARFAARRLSARLKSRMNAETPARDWRR